MVLVVIVLLVVMLVVMVLVLVTVVAVVVMVVVTAVASIDCTNGRAGAIDQEDFHPPRLCYNSDKNGNG